jgi:hypothetical protein
MAQHRATGSPKLVPFKGELASQMGSRQEETKFQVDLENVRKINQA